MRYLFLIGLFFSYFIKAECREILPIAEGEKKHLPVSIIRYRTIAALSPSGGAIDPVCHFKFNDAYFGYLSDHDYSLLRKAVINFNCYSSDDEIVGAGPVRFDTQRHEWIRDIEKRIANTGTSWSAKELIEMRRDFVRAIKVYSFYTIKAYGYAYTEDDTTGNAAWQRRRLHYCLMKEAKALCGDAEYMSAKRVDLTQYILQILRSIEFIDEAPSDKQDTSTKTILIIL